jgi:NosR/NirI family nitrous oxide reductase transcriptional regulator
VKERKQRTKAGVALTRIGANGYYIPIHPIPAAKPGHATADARLSNAQQHHDGDRVRAWLRRELVDHLFPWNREFSSYPLALRAAGIALAVLVTWVWLLGATGRLGAGIILGWWLAWSVYELIVRMKCKPWVKEGPWWGHTLRPASWPDMAAYVSMKNLLIGAALFLMMRGTGVLDLVQDIAELQWLY